MRAGLFTPAITGSPSIWLSFDDISDDFAHHRREFERRAGISDRNDETRVSRIVVNPEGTVEGVAIEADTAGMQRGFGE